MGHFTRLVAFGKGFGSNPQRMPDKVSVKPGKGGRLGKKVSKEKAIQQALDIIDKSKGSNKSPSNPEYGRVDYVKVKDWGSGNPDDLGNLKLASTPENLTATDPFYDLLARHLESLQSSGSLSIAQPANAKPIPPFHKWSFSEHHYIQFLVDTLAVYTTLEKSIKTMISTVHRVEYMDEDSKSRLNCIVTALGVDDRFARGMYIRKDIENIKKARNDALLGQLHTTDDDNDGINNNRDDSNGISSNNKVDIIGGYNNDDNDVVATPNAQAHVQYINQLMMQSDGAETKQELMDIILKLIAHEYVILLTHFTSGGRIGSMAAEKLNLFKIDALHLYKSYPSSIENPFNEFRHQVDVIGDVLCDDEKEKLMDELPSAFRRVSMLLESLARE